MVSGTTRRRVLVNWIAGSVVITVVLLGALLLARRRTPPAAQPTLTESGDLSPTLVLTGRVRSPGRPQLGAAIAGTVREVLVREGDHVVRGQLLVQLEDAQPRAALAQARAALVAAEALATSTENQAELSAAQAERDLARARTLHERAVISTRDLELAEHNAAVARSELDVATARAPAGASTPLAEVARARATVRAAEATLALTRITALAPGTILARRVEPGSAVAPGQGLLDMALDGPTELVAYAREEDLAAIRVGAFARASADAFPESVFEARVNWLAPVVDPSQGTVEIRFAVPSPPAYLRPDMTVSINIEVVGPSRDVPESLHGSR